VAQALTDVVDPLNLLYFGDGGTGKTTHLCHMADRGKILVVNAESGVKRRALERCGVDVANIEVWPEKGEKITYAGLEAEWLRIREALNKDEDAYVGMVWDSITEIYKILLDDVIEAGAATVARTGKARDPRADYGEMSDQVRRLVRKCRDLPCHFGASALTRRDVDDDGAVVYRPAITPALQTDLYGWFDIVVYTTLVDVENEDGQDTEQYRGLSRPAGKFRGKDRYKILPKALVDPTFDRILSYVEEDLDANNDPIMQRARELATAAKQKEAERAATQ
jgi:hypothetical protein